MVLVQFKEDGMEDILPHGNDLLKQLCLDGVGPCSSTRSESMQSVFELDGKKLPEIDDSGYRLTQNLYHDNPPEVVYSRRTSPQFLLLLRLPE